MICRICGNSCQSTPCAYCRIIIRELNIDSSLELNTSAFKSVREVD